MSYELTRDYFESGCLCILTGRMLQWTSYVSDEKAAEWYLSHCVCSRHPEGKLNKNYDEDAEKAMRAIWEKRG